MSKSSLARGILTALALLVYCNTSALSDTATDSGGQSSPSIASQPLGEDLLPPDFVARKQKLSREDQAALRKVMLRIAPLFHSNTGDEAGKVHRWEHPVQLWALVPPEIPSLAEEVQGLVRFVESNGGPAITNSDPEQAQFWILSLSDAKLGSQSIVGPIADFAFDGDQDEAQKFLDEVRHSNCSHEVEVMAALSESAAGSSIGRALTIVREGSPVEDQVACIGRGFAASMGFTHTDRIDQEPSWTQTSMALTTPTATDGVLLRLLYSRDQSSGTDWKPAVQLMLRDALEYYERPRKVDRP